MHLIVAVCHTGTRGYDGNSKLENLLQVIIILFVLCRMWNNEVVGAVDCGDPAANWLSKYMLDQDSGVRLGYYLADIMPRRTAAKKLKQCYKTLRDMDLVNSRTVYTLCLVLILC